MINFPNYQIIKQIYESNNSLVYQGVRNEDNQSVILKVLKEDYPTPEELTRYRQEYDITRRLLDVEGVINVYSLEKPQNRLAISLEDFGGYSLKNWLTERTFTLDELLTLSIQAADILGQIHQKNIIHKDINPANLVFNSTTSVLKVIDFGISSVLPRENPTLKNPNQLEGTLAYISPEQTGRMNRFMDYRTDLYSLGVTLYEMLTGQVPFESQDSMELIHCHIAKTPISAYEINPDIPPILSNIVMKLMAKNVEDRYQSALGLKADLEKCQENLSGFKNLTGLEFELAQNDFSGQFQIPQKLYGRETEINTLLQSFERISNPTTEAKGSEMILVAGYSGVGKTALVHEVHKPMTEKRGHFATGKFDQYQRNIPYSALSGAFNEFCNYLLTESTDKLNDWRDKILNAIGNNGQVLIDVIPQLELIIGKQPPITQVGATEAQNRFNLVFQNFFRTISQKEHPLVLFIDDLQWADLPSLNLLERLMTDINNQYFLIIGAYRDNEVEAAHPLMMMVKELTEAKTTVHTIQLQNLFLSDVNTLIADTLDCEVDYADVLTRSVYEKTQGNAFFTREFLKSLYAQELLVFDWQSQKWQWDVESIKAKQMTSNVVALMANKITLLSQETQNVLRLAACIGNQFDLKTLSLVCQYSLRKTLAFLWLAIEEELVLPLDDNYKQLEITENEQKSVTTRFKFQHDRVQQAAYSLVEEAQAQTVHLQIGRLLLAHADNVEDNIFDITNQYNAGISLIDDDAEKLKLIELNLIGGKKAKAASAYKPAFDHLQTGIELLGKETWQQHYALTLQLHTEIAEAAYLNSDFEEMEKWGQVVLQHAQTALEKVAIYEAQIQAYIAQNNALKALEKAFEILSLLGINFPEQPCDSDIQDTLAETTANLSGHSIETLCNLPQMTAPEKLAIMQILSTVMTAALIANPVFYPLIICKMVNLSIKHGNGLYSVFGYTAYGFILCRIDDTETGFQFGKLSLTLLEQLNAKVLTAKVFEMFEFAIRHWKEHVRNTLKPCLEAYQVGLETGDIIYATYATYVYSFHSYFVGKELTQLEAEIMTYRHVYVQLKQDMMRYWSDSCHQAVLNLLGQTETDFPPYYLIGEVYDERTRLSFHQQANDHFGLYNFYFQKLVLCCLFQAYPQAIEAASKAEQYIETWRGTLPFALLHFYDSLARLGIYVDSQSEEQKALFDRVTANQTKMESWAKRAPMNHLHKFYLVEAERCRVLGKDGEAREYYDKAIELAQENEYLNEEALACELAGKFYLAKGKSKVAQVYLRDAHYAYQQWGALAKVKDLEEKYPQFFAKKVSMPIQVDATLSSVTQLGSSTQSISSFLDLNSVMKAVQALSEEIVLSKLLEKMMHIVIENAGASVGFLLLPQKKQWVIEAKGHVDSDKVKLLQSTSLGNQPIAETIIHYVARTKENVVLNNATQEGQFTRDAHIISQHPQSILCAPLVNQGKLTGILYLENNLITGAFTQDRLQILQIISSQLAISIENAVLYRTLEQKVEERTAQLASANEEITELNEQLKSENIRMGAELEVSRQLQQMLLPKEKELTQVEGLDIAGFMEPADEVGGDYYDVLQHDGRVLMGIGDVTGHGLESGALAIMVQSAVRALLANDETDPVRFLTALNEVIYLNVGRMEAGKNLTLALVNYQNSELRLSGQHEEMIVVRSGELELIDTVDLGFPIGLDDNIADFISEAKVPLNQGDVVVLYTDGITEAENLEKEQYGLERLCEVVKQNWQRTADEIRKAVIDDVKKFIGIQKVFDDITLLVLKRK
ncbi:SpoIIE family protein phosphatase [Candidatus Parabeggiatoa sp. HSG14]|uniref:SpoIIE family protein phosphatase n=1 Tax=Candidatus Parabeggiatoa sp. HSG14 TaxID=3055593 RepID=UPI0025A88CB4|nr:AAA family ATPase [Thiotrichales bacterium HSG14]